jgi:predicted nucleic acid-binding protein
VITEIYAVMRGRGEADADVQGRVAEVENAAGSSRSRMLAAVCIAYGCTLVTGNDKDFPMPECNFTLCP